MKEVVLASPLEWMTEEGFIQNVLQNIFEICGESQNFKIGLFSPILQF